MSLKQKQKITGKIFDFFYILHVLQLFCPISFADLYLQCSSRVFHDSEVLIYASEGFVHHSGTNFLWGVGLAAVCSHWLLSF